MKKIICLILLISILLSTFSFQVAGANNEIVIIPSQDGTINSTDVCVLSPAEDWKISTNSVVAGPTGGYSWYTRSKEATATFKAAEISGFDSTGFTNAGDLKDAMEKANSQMQEASKQAAQAQSEAMQKMVQQQAQMTSQMQQATQQMNASQAQMAKAVEQVAEQQKKFNDAVDAGVEVLSDMIDDVENNNK